MGNNNITGAEWAVIVSFALSAFILFIVFVLGLRALFRDQWRGTRRRRSRSWCPRRSSMIERARANDKISRFRRDLELHRRKSRGGSTPGRHRFVHT